MKFADRVAIVTGGAQGIGAACARAFAEAGARVVVAGRHLEELNRFAGTIGGAARTCDITKKSEVEALFAFAKDWGGRVDIALNATGWGLLKPFTETTEDEIDRITDLQFKGPFYFCQAAVQTLSRGGSIIQISSATATIMLNDHAAYMGTKAGTDHVIRCVAHEFGERGIRANSISPGLTDTPMTAEAKEVPGLFDSFLSGYPLGRIGTKEDIAAAAVWLASDECFMTGQNLQVNGGLTLRRNPTREEIQAAIAAASTPVAA